MGLETRWDEYLLYVRAVEALGAIPEDYDVWLEVQESLREYRHPFSDWF